MFASQPFDRDAYEKRSKGPCFICEMLAGNPDYHHHVIYENQDAVAFLSKYARLYGYTLVAPKEHREQVTGDFDLDEYLALQKLIYRVAETLRKLLPTERVYILSFGSQQGNRHVHWHIAPLPPGVPYEQQETAVLDSSREILSISDEKMASLAQAIRQELEQSDLF